MTHDEYWKARRAREALRGLRPEKDPYNVLAGIFSRTKKPATKTNTRSMKERRIRRFNHKQAMRNAA
jgi:hypothetical protein